MWRLTPSSSSGGMHIFSPPQSTSKLTAVMNEGQAAIDNTRSTVDRISTEHAILTQLWGSLGSQHSRLSPVEWLYAVSAFSDRCVTASMAILSVMETIHTVHLTVMNRYIGDIDTFHTVIVDTVEHDDIYDIDGNNDAVSSAYIRVDPYSLITTRIKVTANSKMLKIANDCAGDMINKLSMQLESINKSPTRRSILH